MIVGSVLPREHLTVHFPINCILEETFTIERSYGRQPHNHGVATSVLASKESEHLAPRQVLRRTLIVRRWTLRRRVELVQQQTRMSATQDLRSQRSFLQHTQVSAAEDLLCA